MMKLGKADLAKINELFNQLLEEKFARLESKLDALGLDAVMIQKTLARIEAKIDQLYEVANHDEPKKKPKDIIC